MSLFIDRRREKLENAMIYFARNTRHCHTLKMYKLLSFLDFEHYRQTGRSVTGLSYYAYPQGPVPAELDEQIKRSVDEQDAFDALAVRELRSEYGDSFSRTFLPKTKFSDLYFTPREMAIMETLAFLFVDVDSKLISEYSHDPNLPWRKVYQKGEGKGRRIPYHLALASDKLIKDAPTISEQEVEMLDELLDGIEVR